jgi:uncharacterized protein
VTEVGTSVPFWRVMPDGVSVPVKVRPKSRRAGVQGQAVFASGPCLLIGVAEAPEDGKANRAVCAVLAAALDVPARTVTVTLGQTRREKIITVTGDGLLLSRKLEAL